MSGVSHIESQVVPKQLMEEIVSREKRSPSSRASRVE